MIWADRHSLFINLELMYIMQLTSKNFKLYSYNKTNEMH